MRSASLGVEACYRHGKARRRPLQKALRDHPQIVPQSRHPRARRRRRTPAGCRGGM